MAASAANTVSDARFAHLRHGINLSHWYAQAGEPSAYTKKHIDEYDTEQDFVLILNMGFDHVRLTLDPGPLFDRHDPGHLNEEWLGYLNASVKMIMSHELAVIIDIHPAGEFNRQLNSSDEHVRDFALFWRALAKNFSTYEPDRLFLEVVNEPEVQDT
jgi:endoglucanase